MPFETHKVRGKLRTINTVTGRIARNTKTGNFIDGGGWRDTPKGRGRAERQLGHLEEFEEEREKKARRHGKIS